MGLNIQALKMLHKENLYKPINGNVLLIGKSTVGISRQNLNSFFIANGIALNADSFTNRDEKTKRSSDVFNIDDSELFARLFPGIKKIDVLDISPDEGANVIVDMNYPLIDDLKYEYDFVYDSSVLDNVFNPAQMITNIAQFLKPNGRVLMVNVSSFFPGAMVSCHPEWFYSFFAINKFCDVKIYLTMQEEHGEDQFQYSTKLWRYQPMYTPNPQYNYLTAVTETTGVCYVIAIAEAGDSVHTQIEFPSNLQYIETSKSQNWQLAEKRFELSNRPIFKAKLDPESKGIAPKPPHLTDHYEYLGDEF
jgi:hypothetical protein